MNVSKKCSRITDKTSDRVIGRVLSKLLLLSAGFFMMVIISPILRLLGKYPPLITFSKSVAMTCGKREVTPYLYI